MVFDPDGTCSYQTATVGSYHEDTSPRRCPLADLVSRFRGELGVAALWYAPIAGYLLLVSAWARRNANHRPISSGCSAMTMNRIQISDEKSRDMPGVPWLGTSGHCRVLPALMESRGPLP